MPCYDPRAQNGWNEGYEAGKRATITDNLKLEEYKDYSMKIDAALCAVLNELEQRNLIESVIVNASRHGLIDIVGWWESHKKDDKARLTKSLHKHSIDEQRVLFELLKGQFDDK